MDLASFVVQQPRLSLVGDSAVDFHTDRFDLRSSMGPVYDILRHPSTATPLHIAIFGDWGSGKTTAMRWLQQLLTEWNKLPAATRKGGLRTPIWFNPWKYDNKQDIWKGLISEVILGRLRSPAVTAQGVIEAGKALGGFLGSTFLNLVGSLQIAGSKIESDKIKRGLQQGSELINPQKPYLNDFEEALRSWVSKYVPPEDRLVVFIDDLDRCPPEIALQVLECIKLFLDIDRLIFVTGLDHTVLKETVRKRYESQGVSVAKADQYLAKIFQVEVELAPTAQQMNEYQAALMNEVSAAPQWSEMDPRHRECIGLSLELLARRNPRELKRLFNRGSVIAAQVQSGDLRFTHGMQAFLIRYIINKRILDPSQILDSKFFDPFMNALSQCAQTHRPQNEWFEGCLDLLSQDSRDMEIANEAIKARKDDEKGGGFGIFRPLIGFDELTILMELGYSLGSVGLVRRQRSGERFSSRAPGKAPSFPNSQQGFRLSARVAPDSTEGSWAKVQLLVEGPVGFQGTCSFQLDPSFTPSVREGPFMPAPDKPSVAHLEIAAYGPFLVGATILPLGIRLELDLMGVTGGPSGWYDR